MKFSVGDRVSLGAILVLVLGHALHAVPGWAYTGGAIRAQVVGLEPGTGRVFYYRTFHDESGAGPEVWFFDLNGENPEQPKRAPALDGPDDGCRHGGENINEAWRSLSPKLRPLSSCTQFDLRISLSSDSVGTDSLWQSPIFEGHLAIEGRGIGQSCNLTIFCEPMIVIRVLYAIPDRTEAIAVVSYIGRAYGCEEVEQPILLTDVHSNTRASRSELEIAVPRSYRQASFTFGQRPLRGCCAGQFTGYFGEVGSPEAPIFRYLVWDKVMMTPPQVWLVSLNSDSQRQPIRYSPEGEDSLYSGWDYSGAVNRLKGRRGNLIAAEPVDLALHLRADSVGVDSVCGVTRYACEVVASTPIGSGAVNLAMFCNTLIQVRGVFPLPRRRDLVIVTYSGYPSGCKEKDAPIVIHPR